MKTTNKSKKQLALALMSGLISSTIIGYYSLLITSFIKYNFKPTKLKRMNFTQFFYFA